MSAASASPGREFDRSRRVLFTSPVQPIGGSSPDVYSWNKSVGPVKVVMTFINHPGLSFLGANVPGVEILEYPNWKEYEAALAEPVDILGISFHINETQLALRMAEYARERGVRQVWAGNFGSYSPEAARHFDRVISGWGEAPVAAALGHEPPGEDEFVHPPMYGCMGTNLLPKLSLHGFLFTSRGCPCTCNFCQTPGFYGKAQPVPLAAIDRVLWEYKRRGIVSVNVLDENFGIFPAHSREVIRLLKSYGLRWIPLCRVDLLLKNLEEWVAHGLFGAHIGVESLNQESLESAEKRINQQRTLELLRRMSEHNLLVQAFYIIGFLDDTVESVRRDIRLLATLDVDIPQVQILTPYPVTPLRDVVESEYGIHDRNLSHYNSRNLVWNHPSITPAEMRELQAWANRVLFTPRRALRTLRKVLLYDCSRRATTRGASRMLRGLVDAQAILGIERGLAASRAWSRRGWYAYEEEGGVAVNAGRTVERRRGVA